MNNQNTISIRNKIEKIGYTLKLSYLELFIKYDSKLHKDKKDYLQKIHNLIKKNQNSKIRKSSIDYFNYDSKINLFLKKEKDLLSLIDYIKHNKNIKDKIYKYYICYKIDKNGRKNKTFDT